MLTATALIRLKDDQEEPTVDLLHPNSYFCPTFGHDFGAYTLKNEDSDCYEKFKVCQSCGVIREHQWFYHDDYFGRELRLYSDGEVPPPPPLPPTKP